MPICKTYETGWSMTYSISYSPNYKFYLSFDFCIVSQHWAREVKMWADQRAKVKEIKDLAIEKETLEKVVKMMREQEIVLKQIHAWYILHYRPAMLKTDLRPGAIESLN